MALSVPVACWSELRGCGVGAEFGFGFAGYRVAGLPRSKEMHGWLYIY